MTDLYNYPGKNFSNRNITTTIATGPVIINNNKEFLLHIAESSNKYQFSGGRLDDNKSPKENAIYSAYEDLKIKVKLL